MTSRLRPFDSLRWRLPLLISTIVATVVVTFLWAAHRSIEQTLIQAGGERAQIAADQVAALVNPQRSSAWRQSLADYPAVRQYVERRTPEAEEAVRTRLEVFARAGPRRVEVWDRAGTRLLEVSDTRSGEAAPVLPPGAPPREAGVSLLQTVNDVTFYEVVADVRAAGGAAIGYLVVRAALTVTPPEILDRLAGRDALVAVGNRTGGLATNFERAVPTVPLDLTHRGVAVYQTPQGEARVGAVAPIAGAPWSAWVEYPQDALIAPATVFLARMIPVSLVFVAFATLTISLIARRLTRPLRELTGAAEALAAGDYARRVDSSRRNEIGRLGAAFNVMADKVAAAHEGLELSVISRTTELAAARIEAERANRAKSQFLSAMSHDLRTPLNAILGHAQLLELAPLAPDHRESTQQILNGGRHLLQLIEGVLDITRIESGHPAFLYETVSVRDVVMGAVTLIEPLAAERQITITSANIPAADALWADRQRLSRVLLNLLSNAVKYNRTGGSVTIDVERRPQRRYRIVITDTGVGIPPAKHHLLFQPFERLGAERTNVPGTGLGLALSRTFTEAMGGTLGFRSVEDNGSAFWIELRQVPAEYVVRRGDVQRDAAEVETAASRGLVLYIEDNASNVGVMERILRHRPGLEMRHAADADAASAMIAERRPDLVLLDLNLPGKSGLEILHDLWTDPVTRPIPKVVVTADATPGLASHLKASGAAACLTKPLDVREVLDMLDEFLRIEAGAHDRG